MFQAGDVVVDKYRIERQIGAGGMGVVLAATHLQLNQPVALKFLIDSPLEPHIASERFLREARATFRLRSEHTVRVMDVGTLPTGEPFMVMELLEGFDFKELLAKDGPLSPAIASLYILQVCAALQEAHAFGIVHRDLKARNLFLTKRIDETPCVKVLDFGISKVSEGAEVAPLTLPDMGMGSPRYMAPEQWASAATVDARADIYATGAVFYELLTGQIPLAGLPLAEVIKRIRAGAVPSPREIRPDLPEALCRVVLKALRPRPEERFPTALHFAQAIREAQPDAEAKGRPRPVAMNTTSHTAIVHRDVMTPTSQVETPQQNPMAQSTERPFENDFAEDVATIVTKSAMDEPEPPPRLQGHHATLQVAEAPPEIQALRYKLNAQQIAQPAMAHPTLQQPLTTPFKIQTPPRFTPPAPSRSQPSLPQPVMMPMLQSPQMGRLPETINQEAVVVPPAPPVVRGSRIPAWLFWTFLVISFLFAGAVAAAVLTRFLQ